MADIPNPALAPLFFHVDMDAFFASVEIHDNPSLEGKPVLIGRNEKRSVVSTASYPARKFGCHSAMPMAEALRRCPQAIVVEPHFQRYSQVSHQIMQIFQDFSDDILQISIDEAFLNMTGMQRLWPSSKAAGLELKRRVKEETGLTISVGIAPSRFLAKMASDYHKPDGLTRVAPGKELIFVDAVGLGKLWGIGKVTKAALQKNHIRSTQELRSYHLENLESMFGQSMGSYLYKASRGIDPGIFQGEAKSRSISTETTFLDDISNRDILVQYLLSMSHELHFRSLEDKVMARTVSLKLRWPDFSLHEAQVTPHENLLSAEQIFRHAVGLFDDRWRQGQPIRLIGLGLGGLYDGTKAEQQELFSQKDERRRKLEETILSMRKKGEKVVKATTLITQPKNEK